VDVRHCLVQQLQPLALKLRRQHDNSGDRGARVREITALGELTPIHEVKGPPSTLWGVLPVQFYHSLKFGQDRHFLKVLGAEAGPVDARRCGAG